MIWLFKSYLDKCRFVFLFIVFFPTLAAHPLLGQGSSIASLSERTLLTSASVAQTINWIALASWPAVCSLASYCSDLPINRDTVH